MPDRTGISAKAAGPDRLTRSGALVADLPAAFATTTFDPADPALAEVFMAGSRTTRLHTGGLPLPMQREISWWIATCHANGERLVHASEWNRWVATAADVVARHPRGRSFADVGLGEWMTAWGRVFHAAHRRMPAPRSRSRAEIAAGHAAPAQRLLQRRRLVAARHLVAEAGPAYPVVSEWVVYGLSGVSFR